MESGFELPTSEHGVFSEQGKTVSGKHDQRARIPKISTVSGEYPVDCYQRCVRWLANTLKLQKKSDQNIAKAINLFGERFLF